MKSYIYQIEAISNLHVGSGEANEGVIDNLIQRDKVTGLPVINSSSLKGALREHCEGQEWVKHVFGSEAKGTDERLAGAYRFFEARLLSIPVRSNRSPYFMATAPMLLTDYCRTARLFGLKCNNNFENLAAPTTPCVFDPVYKGARIEDLSAQASYAVGLPDFSSLTGSPALLLPDDQFSKLCNDDHLPIFARNYLNDGKSENLWYEQVLPRFTRLFFTLLVPDGDKRFDKFNEYITGSLVQIGANATVGYGYCKITQLQSTPL